VVHALADPTQGERSVLRPHTVCLGGLVAGQRLLIDCLSMRAAIMTSDTWDLAVRSDVTGTIYAVGARSRVRWSLDVSRPHSRAVLRSGSATSMSGHR
jgi:hypothetical protein